MNERSKFKCFINGLLPVIFVFGLQNALVIFVMEVLFVWKAAGFKGGRYSDLVNDLMNTVLSKDFNTAVLFTYSVIGVVIFTIWYRKFYKNHFTQSLTLRGYKPILFPGIILFAIGGQAVCEYLINAIGLMFPQLLADYAEIMEKAGLTDATMTPLLAVYAVVLGPICEELIFRGLCYGYLRSGFSFGVACTVQAILFGAFHMNVLQGIYAFIIGFAFGFVMEKTGNLIITILIHIAFNGSSLFMASLLGMVPEGAITTFGVLLGSMILVYISLVMVIRSKPFVERIS